MSDIESEMLDAQLRAARRAQVLIAPCIHCRAVPSEIIERDVYGYPVALGWPLVLGCTIHNPDWPA